MEYRNDLYEVTDRCVTADLTTQKLETVDRNTYPALYTDLQRSDRHTQRNIQLYGTVNAILRQRQLLTGTTFLGKWHLL